MRAIGIPNGDWSLPLPKVLGAKQSTFSSGPGRVATVSPLNVGFRILVDFEIESKVDLGELDRPRSMPEGAR